MKDFLVWLLAGSETVLKEEFLSSLKSRVFNTAPIQGDYEYFHAQEIIQLTQVITVAYTRPFLAPKRIIVIKNTEQLKATDKDLLLKYTLRPSSSTILVLETSLNDLKGEFWQKLSQGAGVFYFKPKQGRELSDWILKEVKTLGKDISYSTAEFLQDRLGGNLAVLKKAIEQLSTYGHQKKEITIDDVELLTGQDYLRGTFDLLKALSHKEIGPALEILNNLWREHKSGSEILGLLTWHFRRLLKIRNFKENKLSYSQMADKLNIKNKFQLDRLLKEADLFTTSQLKQIFFLLIQTDFSLRAHRSLEKYILEFLLIRLCQKQEVTVTV